MLTLTEVLADAGGTAPGMEVVSVENTVELIVMVVGNVIVVLYFGPAVETQDSVVVLVEIETGAGCAGTELMGEVVSDSELGKSPSLAATTRFLVMLRTVPRKPKTRGTRGENAPPVKVELYSGIAVETEVAEKSVIVFVLE